MGSPVPLGRGHAELVRDLQERSAWAQPPREVTELDGWWLRDAPGCGWWVGTVLPHRDAPPHELVQRIADVEARAAAHSTTAGFQISPGAGPAELEEILARRGYRRTGTMSLQVATTVNVLGPEPTSGWPVQLDESPSPAWFTVWQAVHGHSGHQPAAEWAMLHRVARPCAYASVALEGTVVAVGRAVADAGWAGVFGLATLPAARSRGAARAVLAALAGWARTRDADRMYLQVERENDRAVGLYRDASFTELCGYHYRLAPGSAGADPAHPTQPAG